MTHPSPPPGASTRQVPPDSPDLEATVTRTDGQEGDPLRQGAAKVGLTPSPRGTLGGTIGDPEMSVENRREPWANHPETWEKPWLMAEKDRLAIG